MQKTKFRRIQIIITSLFTFILAGCNSFSVSTPTFSSVPSELTDQSVLTNQPCKAPCWYNIIPDQSSTQEVVDVLSNLAFIDTFNIHILRSNWWATSPDEDPVPAFNIKGFCTQPTQDLCVEITIVKDKVKRIIIFPNYKLTLEEIVDNWGNPDYMLSFPYGAECSGCTVILSWSRSSIEVTSVDRRCVEGGNICKMIHDGGKIPHGFIVDQIIYSGSVPPHIEEYNKESRMPWIGFENP
jgi:hypothetical protein